jgi:hypothetical protein
MAAWFGRVGCELARTGRAGVGQAVPWSGRRISIKSAGCRLAGLGGVVLDRVKRRLRSAGRATALIGRVVLDRLGGLKRRFGSARGLTAGWRALLARLGRARLGRWWTEMFL